MPGAPSDGVELQDVAGGERLLSVSDVELHSDGSDDALVSHEVASGKDGIGSGLLGASFNFINSIVGAGIIGLPFALRHSGLWLGILLLFLVAFLIDNGVRKLVAAGQDLPKSKQSFEGVMEHYYGRRGYYTVCFFMFAMAYGAMIGYAIVIGDTIPKVFGALAGADSILASREFMLSLFSLLAILPLCLMKDMSSLAGSSAVSIAFDVIMVIIVVATASAAAAQQGITAEAAEAPYAFAHGSFFAGLGAMSFAFVCQHNSFIVFNSMARPTQRNWRIVSNVSVAFALTVCLIMAIVGYLSALLCCVVLCCAVLCVLCCVVLFCRTLSLPPLTTTTTTPTHTLPTGFLDETKGDILDNFPANDAAATVARLLLALTMVLTFPMEHFVARHIVMAVMGVKMTDKRRYLSTAVLWGSTTLLSLVFTDVGVVLELTGAFSASSLGFILPAAADLGYKRTAFHAAVATAKNSSLPIGQRLQALKPFAVSLFMFAFGIVALVAGTISALLAN
eukprot:PLAT6389.1.p1 GENE.PLAT6389.1~~PLAT6389.1.p1  ORF type:complete len:520 (+),score=147.81 PLAT6389.1:41-1561(+)